MFDRLARVVAMLYDQAGRSKRRPASANPKGRASFRQDQRRSALPYIWVRPSPIAAVLTKTCSGRTDSISMQEALKCAEMPDHAFGVRCGAGKELECANCLEHRHAAAIENLATPFGGCSEQCRFKWKINDLGDPEVR